MKTMRERLIDRIKLASETAGRASVYQTFYPFSEAQCADLADAVLDELMKPSDAMVEAFLTAYYAPVEWRTMIGKTEIASEFELARASVGFAIRAAKEGK